MTNEISYIERLVRENVRLAADLERMNRQLRLGIEESDEFKEAVESELTSRLRDASVFSKSSFRKADEIEKYARKLIDAIE